MPFRKYNRRVLTTVFASLLALITANWVVDPYGIFHANLFKIPVEPSKYYNKIEFLEGDRSRFNSFILGSSAVSFTDPKLLEKYLSGSRFYNLYVESATQYENLALLKYLIRRGYDVKNIYLQVDIPIAFSAFGHRETDYARKLHPSVTGHNAYLYYFEYLTLFPSGRFRQKILVNLHRLPPSKTVIDFTTGMMTAPNQESLIEKDPEAYVRNTASFHERPSRSIRGTKATENLSALEEIKEICDRHGIRLILFTAPENRVEMDKLIAPDYLDFLKKLSDIAEFWDFSGYNSVTTDNRFYYESRHYRPVVSRMIAARIFQDSSISVPPNFGFLVKRDNVDSYLTQLFEKVQLFSKDD